MPRSSHNTATCRVIWIGHNRQAMNCNGFTVGQEGWVVAVDQGVDLFVFFPDLQGTATTNLGVICKSEEFLVVT